MKGLGYTSVYPCLSVLTPARKSLLGETPTPSLLYEASRVTLRDRFFCS